MSVLIDSSVWSIGLRRRKRDLNADELAIRYAWEGILNDGAAAIIGLIRQEVLSGIVSAAEFRTIKERLAFTPDLEVTSDVHVIAAEFYNACRASGIAPGPIDMTICAAAYEHGVPIFTTDPDFENYARHLPITLLKA